MSKRMRIALRFFLVFIFLLSFSIAAQSEALLLYTRFENDLNTAYVLDAATGEEQRITQLENAMGYS